MVSYVIFHLNYKCQKSIEQVAGLSKLVTVFIQIEIAECTYCISIGLDA